MHAVSNKVSQWTLQNESQYTPVTKKHVYKQSEYICNSSFKQRICDNN
jgi:hypothetical protein